VMLVSEAVEEVVVVFALVMVAVILEVVAAVVMFARVMFVAVAVVVVAAADAEHRAVVELHAAVAVVEVAREARALRKSPSSPTDMLAFSLHAVKKTIYS